MPIFRVKQSNGEWAEIPSIVGPQGPKGEVGPKGEPGVSIISIERTAGTGTSGSKDTYTITYSDGTTSEYCVYNGKDGTGIGDMTQDVYDPQRKATDIFKYVDDKFEGDEEFHDIYLKRALGNLDQGEWYDDLADTYKDGTYHRMWRLRFPTGSNFWGRIRLTIIGGYNSYNASGVMSKTINVSFDGPELYSNLGAYTELGGRVERDFRISEVVWNADVNAWEILIWQDHLDGNNYAKLILEAWYHGDEDHASIKAIAMTDVELTRVNTYTAECWKGDSGTTRTVNLEDTPVCETALGEPIATRGETHELLAPTYLGDFEGRTIADLRAALDDWLAHCDGKVGICQFSAGESFVDLWNANDNSTVIKSGVIWTCNIVGGYNSPDYVQLLVSSYYTDAVRVFTKTSGEWNPTRSLVESDEAGNIYGNYLVSEWLQTKADTHRTESADKFAVLDGSGWVYHRTPDEVLNDIGAFSVVDARSNTYDMDTILTQGVHYGMYRYNGGTLGTPYSAGLTNFMQGIIMSYGSGTTHGCQIAFPAGAPSPFYRLNTNGKISEWGAIYWANKKPTAEELFGYPTNAADSFSVPTALSGISEIDFMTKTHTTEDFFARMSSPSVVSVFVSKETDIALSDLPGHAGVFTAWRSYNFGFGLFQDYAGKLYRYNWMYSPTSDALVGWEEVFTSTYDVLHTGNSNRTTLVSTETTPTTNGQINWQYE